jgi:hypothetical protein
MGIQESGHSSSDAPNPDTHWDRARKPYSLRGLPVRRQNRSGGPSGVAEPLRQEEFAAEVEVFLA